MSICRQALEDRIAEINALMRAHAGAIELLDVSEGGEVRVRLVGKCTGCELRPVTLASIIRPGLLAVEGVARVTATGVRVSEEAEQRLAQSVTPERAGGMLGLFKHYRLGIQRAAS
jgi:Fe-S cluster biogenesis protein NfuA